MKNKLYLFPFLVIIILLSIPLGLMILGISSFDEEIEKRHKHPFPDFKNTTIKSYIEEFESYFNDSFGLRSEFISFNAYIRNVFFRTSSSNKVIVGKDGWYYYKMDNNIDIYRGANITINNNRLLSIKNQQQMLQAYLKQKGIPLYFVFTPSKVSIYPEYLPDRGRVKQERTVIDIVTDYLAENTTLNVINTKPELLDAKKNNQLYYKTDTHWNYQGAYAGYHSVVNRFLLDQIISKSYLDHARIFEEIGSYKGEFSDMMGNPSLFMPEREVIPQFEKSSIQYHFSGNNYQTVSKIFQATGERTPVNYITNLEALNDKTILIFHDSFYANFNALNLYAKDFSQIYSVWSRVANKDIIDYVKPDLVVIEATERLIYFLSDDIERSIFQEIIPPIVKPDFEVLAMNTKPNENLLYVEIKNTGESSWSELQRVRLALFKGGIDTGIRANLTPSTIIEPNEIASFVISVPPKYDDYELQMVQEGYVYFGSKIPVR